VTPDVVVFMLRGILFMKNPSPAVTRHDLFPRFSHDVSRLISQVILQAA
jgi:hypothetical protein